MSFASILSGPAAPPPNRPNEDKQSRYSSDSMKITPSPKVEEFGSQNGKRRRSPDQSPASKNQLHKVEVNGVRDVSDDDERPLKKPRRTLTEKENERVIKAVEKIDAMQQSDVEGVGFEEEREEYLQKTKKRTMNVKSLESEKRKVCSNSKL